MGDSRVGREGANHLSKMLLVLGSPTVVCGRSGRFVYGYPFNGEEDHARKGLCFTFLLSGLPM